VKHAPSRKSLEGAKIRDELGRRATLRYTPDLLAALAQLAEHLICNLEVAGSIPVGGFADFWTSP
jgi:hypothetical protein